MFYSQFILAKKGPLGTIWIAAHLERKLRKNQVADTDIGVSVDSILFPDVPIALRLSSHLLLGVVRIYSRKVNYLFDDCSEALLKIKQAFRSTAVDLPPEESTAPYHSITLPETFDLDDFELPDNELYQGNYVDHHVSAREQITLQDSMEVVAYSTSQFGLDERFGDGDTSQIGLDLDEELFLGNVTANEHEVPDSGPQASPQLITPLKRTDGSDESRNLETVQVEAAANADFVEYAEGPSTPGLVEEPNLLNVQKALACDDHLETENRDSKEYGVLNSAKIESSPSDLRHGDDNVSALPSSNDMECEIVVGPQENGYASCDQANDQEKSATHLQSTPTAMEPTGEDVIISAMGGPSKVEDTCNGVVDQMDIEGDAGGVRLDETVAFPSCAGVNPDLEDANLVTPSNSAVAMESQGILEDDQAPMLASKVGDKLSPGNEITPTDFQLQSSGRPEIINAEHSRQKPDDNGILDSVKHNEVESTETPVLQACNSSASHPLAGGECHGTDASEYCLEKNEPSDSASCKKNQSECKSSDEQMYNAMSTDNSVYLDRSAASSLPVPEMLLSVPEGLASRPNDMIGDFSTPDKEILPGDEGGHTETKLVSGKKRSFTESTLTVQSLNSVESVGITGSKRITESIPDDNDLLSSILVGRRSSVFKMKPTPPVPEITSMKRSRSMLRASTKRKVLMDDTMVLNGDTIRQQLINTEDIRRVRKKAPCSRLEILMIQRQFLEDEIFNEPISTGASGELTLLHSEEFDTSRITVLDKDQGGRLPDVAKDLGSACGKNDTEECGWEGNLEMMIDGYDIEAQYAQIANQQAEELNLRSHSEGETLALTDQVEVKTSQDEPLGEIAEIEIEKDSLELADAANYSFVHGLEPASPLKDKSDLDVSRHMDASVTSPEKTIDSDPVKDSSVLEISNVGLDPVSIDQNAEIGLDIHTDCCEPIVPLATSYPKVGEHVDGELSDEMENVNMGVGEEGELRAADLKCEDKDQTSSCIDNEGANPEASYALELEVNGDEIQGDREDPWDVGGEGISGIDHPDIEDQLALDDNAIGIDTEFLNVDDDDVAEDNEETMPSSEDAHLLENSGWSSRTRAVAKYLQTIFDKEAAHGRKGFPMGNLLVGKSRKEASRMFFETLVLKTKDYIQVEQANPFENISIQPRLKLMKSDF